MFVRSDSSTRTRTRAHGRTWTSSSGGETAEEPREDARHHPHPQQPASHGKKPLFNKQTPGFFLNFLSSLGWSQHIRHLTTDCLLCPFLKGDYIFIIKDIGCLMISNMKHTAIPISWPDNTTLRSDLLCKLHSALTSSDTQYIQLIVVAAAALMLLLSVRSCRLWTQHYVQQKGKNVECFGLYQIKWTTGVHE